MTTEFVTHKLMDLRLFAAACALTGIRFALIDEGGEEISEEEAARKLTGSLCVRLYQSRYTMDDVGYHIGYEDYEISLATCRRPYYTGLRGWLVYVDPEFTEARLVSHPPEQSGGCGDDVFELDVVASYFPPDDDCVFDLARGVVESVLAVGAHYVFNKATSTLEVRNHADRVIG